MTFKIHGLVSVLQSGLLRVILMWALKQLQIQTIKICHLWR